VSAEVLVGGLGLGVLTVFALLGNTVNVAARLEAFVAEPDDVVLGPATHLLLDGAIPTEPLGEFQLKGLRQKIQAFRVAKG